MSVRILLPLCVLLLAFERSAVAMKCYSCINLKSNTPLLPTETDSSCKDIDSSTSTTTCSDIFDKCIYGDLSVTVSTLFGEATATLQYRGCADSLGVSNVCHEASTSDLKGLAKIALSKFSPKITGSACYCDTNLCDPRCNGVWLGDQCFAVWVIIVVVIVCVVCSVGFCVFIYKCCNRGSTGVVIRPAAVVVTQPVVTVVQPAIATNTRQAAHVTTAYPMQAAQVTTAYPMQAAQVTTAYQVQAAQVTTAYPVQAGVDNPGYAVSP